MIQKTGTWRKEKYYNILFPTRDRLQEDEIDDYLATLYFSFPFPNKIACGLV